MQKDPFRRWLMKYHTEQKGEGNEDCSFNALTLPIKWTVSCHLSEASVCIGNRMGAGKIKDEHHTCFQKLLKFPESSSNKGNFSNF